MLRTGSFCELAMFSVIPFYIFVGFDMGAFGVVYLGVVPIRLVVVSLKPGVQRHQ